MTRCLRAALALAFVTLAVTTASAETELIVLGPAAEAGVPAVQIEHVKQALASAAVAPPGKKSIDSTCAADTSCLGKVGSELGAKRVVAVAVAGQAAKLELTMLLVDVGAKELIGKRVLVVADSKLTQRLGAELKSFIANAPVERAKDLFTQGNEHYALGEFAEALELYKRAYHAKALDAFLFNIAQCHRKLGQQTEAIQMYQSYLLGVPDAQNRAVVETLIAESRAALAEDQRHADEAAALQAQVDSDRLATEKKQAEATAAAERRKIEEAKIKAQRERELEHTYNRHPSRRWAFVGGAIGAAGLIAGGTFALLSRSAQSSFDSAGCGDPARVLGAEPLATCHDTQSRGETDARLANILLASGGGLLAVSLVVFVLDPGNLERPDTARARVAIAPGSVQVVIRW